MIIKSETLGGNWLRAYKYWFIRANNPEKKVIFYDKKKHKIVILTNDTPPYVRDVQHQLIAALKELAADRDYPEKVQFT